MGAGEESELVARRMRGLVGFSDETAPAEETFWAVRKLFEAAAAERPLIVVFEDVHWAEPLLLDLIEYLVGSSHRKGDSSCSALHARSSWRSRPSWAVEDGNQIVGDLGGAARGRGAKARSRRSPRASWGRVETARIVRTAEGNPLFLEQLVATERGTR